MTHEEYIMYLDGIVKQSADKIKTNEESIGKLIEMAKMIKDDLDNIFVRLDELEANNG